MAKFVLITLALAAAHAASPLSNDAVVPEDKFVEDPLSFAAVSARTADMADEVRLATSAPTSTPTTSEPDP